MGACPPIETAGCDWFRTAQPVAAPASTCSQQFLSDREMIAPRRPNSSFRHLRPSFPQRSSTTRSTRRRNESFLYVHSIVDYQDGVADVTLHVDDHQNLRARLLGVPRP